MGNQLPKGHKNMFSIHTVFSILCFLGLVSDVASLSATPKVQPPSKNPDVLRSFVFGNDDARCWELLSPSEPIEDEEEDEVEYWYPITRRYFEFSIPPSQSSETLVQSTSTTMIRQTSFGCGKLGYELWDSSIALCLHLGRQLPLIEGKRILELGSGCGLPSVVCRDLLQADAVLATDFWQEDGDGFDGDRLVPTKFHGMNLEYNVVAARGNKRREAAVQRLDWHDRASAVSARESFRPDVVIGSDLMYYPMDIEPLLNVLETFLVEDGDRDGADGKQATETRVFLVSALAPAEREALPEFRSKLPVRFSATHTVTMKEMALGCEETEGEDHKFLLIDIVPKQKTSS
ncbi:unnamed protein product [Pseudo-nitzschia multistriata]|uniref:Uncharacterized protein n=1 Tax=Pseudo-nitzschia multistriata TaxID=183589 RepID=A0A448Z903_9STRA|nr:unnamed protein product [Pseudo-nitzschia multistriata]